MRFPTVVVLMELVADVGVLVALCRGKLLGRSHESKWEGCLTAPVNRGKRLCLIGC